MENQIKTQREKYEKESEFYEKALQKRFDQMEEFEAKADALEIKCSQLESKLQKSENLCNVKNKEIEKLTEQNNQLRQDLNEKDEIIDKLPKEDAI